MAKESGDHDSPEPISDDEEDEEDEEEEEGFVSHHQFHKNKRKKTKKKKKGPKKAKPKSIWSQVWMYYWGAHQRVLEGKCCVIGLQSTGEAAASQALAEGEEVDDFISTPAAILDKVSILSSHIGFRIVLRSKLLFIFLSLLLFLHCFHLTGSLLSACVLRHVFLLPVCTPGDRPVLAVAVGFGPMGPRGGSGRAPPQQSRRLYL